MQGRRNLGARSHATSNVWSDVGFACVAYPVCDALPQRRQRAGRQTRKDQQPRREARTGGVAGRAGRAPRLNKASEAGEPEQRWEETELSGGAAGLLLSRTEPRDRLGSALGNGERERGRGRKSAAGRALPAAETGAKRGRLQEGLKTVRARQAVPPAAEAAQNEPRATRETRRVKWLQTDKEKEGHHHTRDHTRKRAQGSQAGTRIQGPEDPEGPQVAQQAR